VTTCARCGSEDAVDACHCVECGKLASTGQDERWKCVGESQGDSPWAPGAKSASRGLAVASVLLIIAGVLALVQGAILFLAGTEWGPANMDELGCLAMISVLFGVIAMMTGYGVLKRSSFPFVVVGCILAMFSVGFVVGSVLAFVAFVLAVMYKDEF